MLASEVGFCNRLSPKFFGLFLMIAHPPKEQSMEGILLRMRKVLASRWTTLSNRPLRIGGSINSTVPYMRGVLPPRWEALSDRRSLASLIGTNGADRQPARGLDRGSHNA